MKKNISVLIFSLLLLGQLLTSCSTKTETNPKPYLIVLSLDGFRWDYPDHANTPTLDSLSQVGVRTNIIPSYPTKTFPNHYTLATGLYPGHHGIVLNGFYAVDLGKQYSLGNRRAVADADFYGGEPIWNTCEKQAVKTATLFWVGSEAPINHLTPTYWSAYNQKLSFESRIDSLFNWLSLPETQRPHLIMWYYHEPDHTGHQFGPRSLETVAEVERLDHYLGMFFKRMRQLPDYHQLNFIVTSDHGMGEISPDRQVILDETIDTSWFERFDGWNPNWNFKVKAGLMEKVYSNLKKVSHVKVYHHDSIPDRLHYGSNPRTYDFTLEADSGYSIYWSWNISNGLGTHGYDNRNRDMHAIFYAAGPAFKKGYQAPAFENVNLYELMAEILHIVPVKTDGELANTESMLLPKSRP
ncbi:MAG: alkaline phosphatase family protein [Bacteroidetes bacterium CG_4_9_14_3_um_filter_41_19]|nr:MAG: alkaline phosphatase family protein [Bacteroidetes bacterium CG_4_9_14_3_um_filter_41_19]